MIGLIDVGTGNTNSVYRVLRFLGCKAKLCSEPSQLMNCNKLIFPGVGGFAEVSGRLIQTKMKEAIKQLVINEKSPFLGICLGMQLMAEKGHEGGLNKGLGLIDAEVKKLAVPTSEFRLPHIGWNDVYFQESKLFKNISNGSCFYFVHSYAMTIREQPKDKEISIATSDYGNTFIAGFEKDNLFGVQFHPEKSQQVGIQLLKNYIEI